MVAWPESRSPFAHAPTLTSRSARLHVAAALSLASWSQRISALKHSNMRWFRVAIKSAVAARIASSHAFESAPTCVEVLEPLPPRATACCTDATINTDRSAKASFENRLICASENSWFRSAIWCF